MALLGVIVSGVLLIALVAIALRLRKARKRLEHATSAFENASVQLESLQMAFQQFVPQMVVENIINRGVSVSGERREVTILFADLIGFTAMSERLEPEWVVRVLNGYFRAMSQTVTRHNGHVAKFMGDGIMALFGTPETNPWQTMDAVRAALEMRIALSQYNAELLADGREPLTIAIGVHVGSVVAGVVGSTQLVEYTVIGDVVNTASRIERLTRHFGKDILISAAVQQRLDDRFVVHPMEPVAVKGKTELLQTFAVDTYRE